MKNGKLYNLGTLINNPLAPPEVKVETKADRVPSKPTPGAPFTGVNDEVESSAPDVE